MAENKAKKYQVINNVINGAVDGDIAFWDATAEEYQPETKLNALKILEDVRPYLYAQYTSDDLNITGDGTDAPIKPSSIKEVGINYTSSTGVVSIITPGYYKVNGRIWCRGITTSHTSGIVFITYSTGAVTRAYQGNPGAALAAGGQDLAFEFEDEVQLLGSDTILASISISGSTKVVDISTISKSSLSVKFLRGL